MITMSEAKKLGVKAAGEEFACEKSAYYGGGPTGAIGVVLPELSSHGKVQATLSCTEPGCTETHVREASDWHQSTKCDTHKKTKSKSGKSATPGTGGGRSVKLADGTVLREFKVLDSDDADARALKEESNAIFETFYAAQAAERETAKAQAAEERKAKQEADKQAREAKQALEKKAALSGALERARALAAERGLTVSKKLIAEVEA